MSQNNDSYPGRAGIMPRTLDGAQRLAGEERAKRKAERLALRGMLRDKRTVEAYTRAVWWGFPAAEAPNRALRRAARSKKLAGPYGRCTLLDAYRDPVDRRNPADMEFAKFSQPIDGNRGDGLYHKPKHMLEMPPLVAGLLARLNGEDNGNARTA